MQLDKSSDFRFLRIAGFLSRFDSSNPEWVKISATVAKYMIREEPTVFKHWITVFDKVRGLLAKPLTDILAHTHLPSVQSFQAASALAEFFSEEPLQLIKPIQVADKDAYAFLLKRLTYTPDILLEQMTKELDRQWQSNEEAAIIAQTAVTLVHLGSGNSVWPMLRSTPNPTIRTYLIHRLAQLRVDQNRLIERLVDEVDLHPDEQQALILALGEYAAEDEQKYPDNNRLHEYLLEQYRENPNPGVHSAVEWFYRVWGQQKYLADSMNVLAGQSLRTGQHWYVNNQRQTFVIIRGSNIANLGSPLDDDRGRDEDEQMCRRLINRDFAIATMPVTIAQFRCFDKSYKPYTPKGKTIDVNAPATGISWYHAMEYCLWLSEQEGIAKNQICYEKQKEKGVPGEVRPETDYLSRSGYRLPTEAEWEFTCRAGTTTPRYFGVARELLDKYAWYLGNTDKEMPMPVGLLKPNNWGLFDTLGNVWEWCQETYKHDREDEGEDKEDDSIQQTWSKGDRSCVTRGGGYLSESYPVRAACRDSTPPADSSIYHGFRVARTLRLVD